MSRSIVAVGLVVTGLLVAACGTRSIGSWGLPDAAPADANGDTDRPLDGPARDGGLATADSSPGADTASPDSSLTVDAPPSDLSRAPDTRSADSSPVADTAPPDLPFGADGSNTDARFGADAAIPDLPAAADAQVRDRALTADTRALDGLAKTDANTEDAPMPDGPTTDSPFRVDEPTPDQTLAGTAGPESQDAPDDGGPVCPRTSERPERLARWEPPEQPGVHIASIAYATNMAVTFVGMTNGAVFHAGDGTAEAPSWSRIDDVTMPGAPSLPNLAVSGIVTEPTAGKDVWVTFFGGPEGFGHKVWKTATGGQFWEELTGSPGENIWSLSLNPLDPDVLYAVTTGQSVVTEDAGLSERIRRSTDRGVTWGWWGPDERDLHTLGTNTTAVGYDPNQASPRGLRIWTGDTTGGLWVSSAPDPARIDSVRTWAAAGPGTPARTVNHLSVVVDGGGEHVAAAYRSWASDGIWLSDDGGQTWRNGHGACLPSAVVVYSVTINPRYPTTLYAFTSAGALRSDDGGTTWW